MRALAESLLSHDILVVFGKMADSGYMRCTILTVSLEHFDWYCNIVITFGLLVCSGCTLSRFKMVSFTKCLQITRISHDTAHVAWETEGIHTFCDLSSYVNKSRHLPHVAKPSSFIAMRNSCYQCTWYVVQSQCNIHSILAALTDFGFWMVNW